MLSQSREGKEETIVLPMQYYGVSEPLSELVQQRQLSVTDNWMLHEKDREPLYEEPEPEATLKLNENAPSTTTQSQVTAPLAAVAGTSFEGPGKGIPGYVVTSIPPDTTLAVGPNHIVAWVNSQYAVFDKSGTPLLPAPGFANGNTLFAGVGGVCETTNRGDPILQYDRMANRWFLSQFAFPVNGSGNPIFPYYQCIAVSTTSSPLGSYYRYVVDFTSIGFNDYGKLGVWPDAYYTAYNIFGGSPAGSNIGAALCASDRTKMLAGDPSATTLCAPTNFYGGGAAFLPADLDGTTLPTDMSQGGIFMRQSTAPALRILKLKPNFAAGTVTLTDGFGGALGSFINIPLGPTTRACNGGGGACVAQPGTTRLLDTLGDRLMYRLAYRNRAGVDSLMVVQSVDPDGAGPRGSAKRWYEIRSPLTSTPTLFQSANYDPSASGDRWMGSIAMDGSGNMLMGYSIANAGVGLKPSIAVAGRLVSDPVNTLQAENIFITGGGSQTGFTRWGDYTTMQIDPADDATFWYIGEYLAVDHAFNWSTRIASFKFPAGLSANGSTLVNESCPPPNSQIDPGERVTVNLKLLNNSGATSSLVATLQSGGGVLAPSGSQNYGALAAGAMAGRDFSFTADPSLTPGQTITATLQLQDGASNLGTVSFNFTAGPAPCGGVRLVVTSTLTRTNSMNVLAHYTVQNIGSTTAANVILTTAKLGTTNTSTPLPQPLGNIPPGGSASGDVNFTNSSPPGTASTLTLGGTYTGGTFSSTRRVTVP